MTTRPATVNFRLYPYATFTETTTLLDSEQAPIDLTGRSALMHIRRDREDDPKAWDVDTLFGIANSLGTTPSVTPYDPEDPEIPG